MKIDTIQTSFVGGEFGPSLFGRTDVAQYSNAVALLQNFLIRPSGSIISAPGTEFINACKTGGSTSIARLLQFTFSRTDAYVIEMGVGYFRFYTQGAIVCSTGTTPYEVAHTYTAAQIPDVHYCQINDVIFLTHKDHPPRTLTRYAAASWTLADFGFTGGPFKPDNTTSVSISCTATAGTISMTSSSAIFVVSGSTMGHKNSYWKIAGLRTDSTTGLQVQGYVQITNVVSSTAVTASVIKTLASSAATTLWAEGSWCGANGYPARVTFHEQRLFMARTDKEPQTVWGSKSFIFTDFALDGAKDDDALNLQLASNESNDIKWLASGKSLVAGTYGGEFTIESGDSSPLTPSNTNAHKQTSWGSEPIPPKKIGNYFYYIQRFGQKLRELFYFWEVDTYKSVDKTILSPHITEDGIIDMAFQQNPDTVLWCVTSNGTIACLTREVDQDIQGWSKITTDGVFEAITAIPSQQGPYDEIWVVVKRTINGSARRYIERFVSQVVPDLQDQCWYVHSGLSWSSYEDTNSATVATLSVAGSYSSVGTTVAFTSSVGYFAADDVGQRIRVIAGSSSTIVGEAKITGYTSSTSVIGTVKYAFSGSTFAAGSWGVSVNRLSGLSYLESKSTQVLADGGTSKPAQVVSSGSITLPYDAFIVVVGLGYEQKVKTLPQEAGSQRGTAQGKKQRISEVAFKVNRSHKGFQVGGADDGLDIVSYVEQQTTEILYTGTVPSNFELNRISFRDPSTPMGTPELLYTGIIPNVSFQDDYRYGSQVTIVNSDPLPIELLALMTTLDTIDKA